MVNFSLILCAKLQQHNQICIWSTAAGFCRVLTFNRWISVTWTGRGRADVSHRQPDASCFNSRASGNVTSTPHSMVPGKRWKWSTQVSELHPSRSELEQRHTVITLQSFDLRMKSITLFPTEYKTRCSWVLEGLFYSVKEAILKHSLTQLPPSFCLPLWHPSSSSCPLWDRAAA